MSNQAIQKLGVIMGVWAHPDDETYMVGGLLSQAAANGQKVVCVTATRGEAGVQDESKWPKAQLKGIRTAEMQAVQQILGMQHHQWLDYADGFCKEVPREQAISRLAELIDHHSPDTIITFPPDGLTGHPDHMTVSEWARAAATRSRVHPKVYFAVQIQEQYDAFLRALDEQFNMYFALDEPVSVPSAECDVVFQLPPERAAQKAAALKAMPSQTQAIFEYLGDKGVQFAFGTEALVNADGAARWGAA